MKRKSGILDSSASKVKKRKSKDGLTKSYNHVNDQTSKEPVYSVEENVDQSIPLNSLSSSQKTKKGKTSIKNKKKSKNLKQDHLPIHDDPEFIEQLESILLRELYEEYGLQFYKLSKNYDCYLAKSYVASKKIPVQAVLGVSEPLLDKMQGKLYDFSKVFRDQSSRCDNNASDKSINTTESDLNDTSDSVQNKDKDISICNRSILNYVRCTKHKKGRSRRKVAKNLLVKNSTTNKIENVLTNYDFEFGEKNGKTSEIDICEHVQPSSQNTSKNDDQEIIELNSDSNDDDETNLTTQFDESISSSDTDCVVLDQEADNNNYSDSSDDSDVEILTIKNIPNEVQSNSSDDENMNFILTRNNNLVKKKKESNDGLPYEVKNYKNGKIKSYEDLLHHFPNVPENEILEEIPLSQLRSVTVTDQLPDNKFTNEEIEYEIKQKIAEITDHFELLEKNAFPDDGHIRRPKNFHGSYLPTPPEIRFLKNLEIEINWELSPIHKALIKLKNKTGSSGFYVKYLKKKGLKPKVKNFTRIEDEIILKNWIEFQEKYKFFDIRPLIGVRTLKIKAKKNIVKCTRVSYISKEQKVNFLLFLMKGLPARMFCSVHSRIVTLSLRLLKNQINYNNTHITGREVAHVKYVVQNFGGNFTFVENVLGKRSNNSYGLIFRMFLRINHLPIRVGPWTQQEDMRLIKGIFQTLDAKDYSLICDNKTKIKWKSVFDVVRTRMELNCYQRWNNTLKQIVHTKDRLKRSLEEKEPEWTSSNTIELIDIVYKSDAEKITDINFSKMSKNHFPGFCDSFLRNVLSFTIKTRVPHEMKFQFEGKLTIFLLVEIFLSQYLGAYYINFNNCTSKYCDETETRVLKLKTIF